MCGSILYGGIIYDGRRRKRRGEKNECQQY